MHSDVKTDENIQAEAAKKISSGWDSTTLSIPKKVQEQALPVQKAEHGGKLEPHTGIKTQSNQIQPQNKFKI